MYSSHQRPTPRDGGLLARHGADVACEVLSLGARHLPGAVVAATATGAAVAGGRGGLALQTLVALAIAYAAAPALLTPGRPR